MATHAAGWTPKSPSNSVESTPSFPRSKPLVITRGLDAEILRYFNNFNPATHASLSQLLEQYDSRSGRVLDVTLPNGSIHSQQEASTATRTRSVVTVAHVVDDGLDAPDIYLASGFFIQPTGSEPLVVTCAHTLEEARYSRKMRRLSKSGTLILTADHEPLVVSELLSSLPRSDVLLLRFATDPRSGIRAAPVSMFPAATGTTITMPTFDETLKDGSLRSWTAGKIDGYRDTAGREAEPGTYDTLSHLIFSPPPTSGTSGAPIFDEASGCVVGMVTGSRMYNRIEGLKGWGTPSEAIFEMFSLPGWGSLNGPSQDHS